MKEDYSVLMSVYYKENADFFRQSIESMLNQTVKPSDFVIVCDGPLNDELNNVIDEYTNKYTDIFSIVRREVCGGLGNSLNDGLDHCRHDIVARMDSDDIAKEDRMAMQLSIFENMEVDIVSGTVEEFDGDISNIIAVRCLPETSDEIDRFARKRNPFNHPCVSFRKNAVIKAGGYKEFPLFEDYYLWVRMLMNGSKGYNVQKTLLLMRSGEQMYSRRGGFSYAKKAVKFKKELKRMGFYSFSQFMVSAGAHVVVSLMPNGLRRLFYKKVLRK